MNTLHEGHRARLKEKFIINGLKGLSEHEILELLLFYSVPRKNTNELAHEIIKSCGGSLLNVLDSDITDLEECGISKGSAILIKLISELSTFYYTNKNELITDKQLSIDDIAKGFIPMFLNATKELIYVVCLTNDMRAVAYEQVLVGDSDFCGVKAKSIAKIAFKYDTSLIVLIHNHLNTSGKPKPSTSDIISTRKLVESLKSLDIEIFDHLIISGNDYYSILQGGISFKF